MASIKKMVFVALAVVVFSTGAFVVGGGGTAIAHKNNGCPTGWTTQGVAPGDVFDKNGDGIICTKDIPGKGKGNSNTDADDFHTDGHNHKDNHP